MGSYRSGVGVARGQRTVQQHRADAVYDHVRRTGGTIADAWHAVRAGHAICYVTAGDEQPLGDAARGDRQSATADVLTWPHALAHTGIGNALTQLQAQDVVAAQRPVRLQLRAGQDMAAVLRAFHAAATTSAAIGATRGAWQAAVTLVDHLGETLVRYEPAGPDASAARRFVFPLPATTGVGKALRAFMKARVTVLGAAYAPEQIVLALAVPVGTLHEHARTQLREASADALAQCRAVACRDVVIRALDADVATLRDGRVVGDGGNGPAAIPGVVSPSPHPSPQEGEGARGFRSAAPPSDAAMVATSGAQPIASAAPQTASPASLNTPQAIPAHVRAEMARVVDANDPPWPVPTLLSIPPTPREWWIACGDPEMVAMRDPSLTVTAMAETLTERARGASRSLRVELPMAESATLHVLALVSGPVPVIIKDRSMVECCRYPGQGATPGGIDFASIGEHFDFTLAALEDAADETVGALLREWPLSFTLIPSLLVPTRAQQEWASALVMRLAGAGYRRVIVRTDAGLILAASDQISVEALGYPSASLRALQGRGLSGPVTELDDARFAVGDALDVEGVRRLVTEADRPIEVHYSAAQFPAEVQALFPALEAELGELQRPWVSFHTPLRQVAFGRAAILERYACVAQIVMQAAGVAISKIAAAEVAESCLTNFGIAPQSIRGGAFYFSSFGGSLDALHRKRERLDFTIPPPAQLAGALRETYYALQFAGGDRAYPFPPTSPDLTATAYGLLPHLHQVAADKRYPAFQRALSAPRPGPLPPSGLVALLERFPQLMRHAVRTLQTTWQHLREGAGADAGTYVKQFAARITRRGDITFERQDAEAEAIRIGLLALAMQEVPHACARQMAHAYRAIRAIAVPADSTATQLARPLAAANHPWHAAWETARVELARLHPFEVPLSPGWWERAMAPAGAALRPVHTAIPQPPSSVVPYWQAGVPLLPDREVTIPHHDVAQRQRVLAQLHRAMRHQPPDARGVQMRLSLTVPQALHFLSQAGGTFPLQVTLSAYHVMVSRSLSADGGLRGFQIVSHASGFEPALRALWEWPAENATEAAAIQSHPLWLWVECPGRVGQAALQSVAERAVRLLGERGYRAVCIGTTMGELLAASDALDESPPDPWAVQTLCPPLAASHCALSGDLLATPEPLPTGWESMVAWRLGHCGAIVFDCRHDEPRLTAREFALAMSEKLVHEISGQFPRPRGDAYLRVDGVVVVRIAVDAERRRVTAVVLNGDAFSGELLRSFVAGSADCAPTWPELDFVVEVRFSTPVVPQALAAVLPALRARYDAVPGGGLLLSTPIAEEVVGQWALLGRAAQVARALLPRVGFAAATETNALSLAGHYTRAAEGIVGASPELITAELPLILWTELLVRSGWVVSEDAGGNERGDQFILYGAHGLLSVPGTFDGAAVARDFGTSLRAPQPGHLPLSMPLALARSDYVHLPWERLRTLWPALCRVQPDLPAFLRRFAINVPRPRSDLKIPQPVEDAALRVYLLCLALELEELSEPPDALLARLSRCIDACPLPRQAAATDYTWPLADPRNPHHTAVSRLRAEILAWRTGAPEPAHAPYHDEPAVSDSGARLQLSGLLLLADLDPADRETLARLWADEED